MITGIVNAHLDATVRLTVHGPGGMRRVPAIVDTGFDGWLSLPPSIITNLQLPWHKRGTASLADGSEILYDIFAGVITWGRRRRAIAIDEADTKPLVGTALLANHELAAVFRSRGKVMIKRLSK